MLVLSSEVLSSEVLSGEVLSRVVFAGSLIWVAASSAACCNVIEAELLVFFELGEDGKVEGISSEGNIVSSKPSRSMIPLLEDDEGVGCFPVASLCCRRLFNSQDVSGISTGFLAGGCCVERGAGVRCRTGAGGGGVCFV